MAYAGEAEAGAKALAPFRALAQPIADMVRPMPYPEIYPPEEEGYHPVAVVHTTFADDVDASSVRTILERLGEPSSAMMRVTQIRALGGSMARVPNDATAFGHRDRRFMVNVAALFGSPQERPEHEGWVTSFAEETQRGPSGAYVGFLGDDGAARIREAYPPETFERLAAVKGRYDPDNVFRLNHNVRPS
jgi:FAD/FMN-containing dehydrogenase